MKSERRSFLISLNSRVAAFAAAVAGSAALAQGKARALRWEPARHEQDDWLDQLRGVHRLVFDTTNPPGFGEALAFAANFMRVNNSAYGLRDSDLAVVVVARHHATPFAFNQVMWAKYGAPIAAQAGSEAAANPHIPAVDALMKQGVQFAVCSTATHAFAGSIAAKTGGNADAIFSELIANLLGNSRIVPAGIVAVSRAQERGYSVVKA